jgi:hypothetical protein
MHKFILKVETFNLVTTPLVRCTNYRKKLKLVI